MSSVQWAKVEFQQTIERDSEVGYEILEFRLNEHGEVRCNTSRWTFTKVREVADLCDKALRAFEELGK